MEERINKIEKEIEIIKLRNQKVELDKKWETSKVRFISLTILTYFVMIITMFFIKVENPFINAIIPTLGFILSTQSLPFIKRLWIKNNNK